MTPGNERLNLVLTGFMGTGKSTVGRLLARQMDRDFVDTDALIEHESGRRIAAIFAAEGEAGFRRLEAQICRRLAAEQGRVIATGGGALLDPRTREAFLASSVVVCLTCDLETIIRRVGVDPSRPLYSAERDRLGELLAARLPIYHSLPHMVDSTGLSPEETAEEVRRIWLAYQ